MRNLRARFVVPLKESVRIKSGHLDLDPIIRNYRDTSCTAPSAIWNLGIIIPPGTRKVCVCVSVNIQLYTWPQ